jgi:hypothetical protein
MDFLDRIRSRAHERRIGSYMGARIGKGLTFLQHDMDVANGSGATVRGDINDALEALATFSSGATAPATTYAYQPWADTTNGLLKQRNAANTNWVVRGSLAESFVLARSSNTIIGVANFGQVINCTSTFTQTLTAAATLGDGFYFTMRNNGSGVITIDPNGAETIDGATTINLQPGESCVVWCNGSAFITIGRANINGLTEDSSPDLAADYVMVYDASAGGLKKVLLGRIGSVLGTEQATTSGTSIDFTSIPSWVKRITVLLDGVSTSGTAGLRLQIGDSGGIEATGYAGMFSSVVSGGTVSVSALSAGFDCGGFFSNAGAAYGRFVLDLEDASSNVWVASWQLGIDDSTDFVASGAGRKALSATLDRVRLITTNGTDTFDAGAVNIKYEA